MLARSIVASLREIARRELDPPRFDNLIRQLEILSSLEYVKVYRKRIPSAIATSLGHCGICLEDISVGDKVIQLPCNPTHPHVFHKSCIEPWIVSHSTCPNCRGSF